jgi:hypothetical protein
MFFADPSRAGHTRAVSCIRARQRAEYTRRSRMPSGSRRTLDARTNTGPRSIVGRGQTDRSRRQARPARRTRGSRRAMTSSERVGPTVGRRRARRAARIVRAPAPEHFRGPVALFASLDLNERRQERAVRREEGSDLGTLVLNRGVELRERPAHAVLGRYGARGRERGYEERGAQDRRSKHGPGQARAVYSRRSRGQEASVLLRTAQCGS